MKTKLEKVLDRNAKKIMVEWRLEGFKKSFPTLFKTIMVSMVECCESLDPLTDVVTDASNVKGIYYNSSRKLWLVEYRGGQKPDEMEIEVLMDFLRNG